MIILFLSTWIGYRTLHNTKTARQVAIRRNWLQKTVFLLSIDGFRYDYLRHFSDETPNIHELLMHGVRSEKLIPSFPTKTFPNHYTLATGMYPATHGILNNNMYNKVTRRTFTMSSTEPEWWKGGEPIWISVEKQNHSASTIFFPGSNVEIQGKRPSRYQEVYDDEYGDINKINLLMKYFDEDDKRVRESAGKKVVDIVNNRTPDRLNLLYVTYFSGVDHEGHTHGPLSTETRMAVRDIDRVIGYLFAELRKRNVDPFNDVNIVLVSDHGMAELNKECELDIRQIITNQTELEQFRSFYGPYVELTAIDRSSESELISRVNRAYDQLKVNEEFVHGGRQYVTYRPEEVPHRLNYHQVAKNFPDICPDIIVSVESHCWMSTFFVPTLLGDHGYDIKHDSMGALFVASGPKIQQSDVPVPPFQNIHLYPLLAEMMELNRTRLPKIDGALDAVQHVLKQQQQQH